MEELMMGGEPAATAALSFPTLKYMKLKGLRKLKSICSDDVLFPSLATFVLWRCPKIKKLPRGLMNEKRTLTECHITGPYGGREWWSGLMWQDDGFKSFIESTLTPDSREMLFPLPVKTPASTDPIMAQVPMQVGISGAGPSFSNPQGVKEDKQELGQEKGEEDIGQDEAFNQVCNFLNDDDVGMVGIYGMGGVGKTTLMKKIRKEYLEPSNFKVILVVVSKSIDIDYIQKDIMEGMGLPFDKSESRHTRAEKINKALGQEKVALLFDDLWEHLELEEIGILGPIELDPSILKIVFTTRSEKVCCQMEPDEQIKLECLGWDDSWALFEKSVGKKALESDYEIETIAKEIAKECKGCPLALTVIGRAMKWKKNRRQWEHALRTLQKSSLEDPDTEKQLFARLKLSYDTLPDNGEKNCFLYCCLFPEDEKIYGDQLIEYWIAEGFLALSGSYLEASTRGADIIGTLQAACLLERADYDMYVKMHDVIRHMGLWIASELTLNIFMHGGSQLIKSKIEEKWREAHRIYVLRGDGFPEQPLCPNLTTLIIGIVDERIKISNSFFNSMGKLRVLKLKNVDFGDEKVEIGQLLELRYLSVRESNLRTLPMDIIKLSKLEVLDLRENDDFEGVPENSIRHLVELRKLLLHLHCRRKFNFDAVIVEFGYLSKLEIMKMHLIEEDNDSDNEFFEDDESCDTSTYAFEDRVDMVNGVLGQLCDSLRDLDMLGWPFAGPVELVSALEQMDKLVVLKIDWVKVRGVVIFTRSFLPSLKTFEISCCFGLEKIEVSPRAFENIRELEIHGCDSLKCIVGLEHLRRTLLKLTIKWCHLMEELMMEEVEDDEMEGGPAALSFPTLKYMKLQGLRKLKSICSDDVLFPSLTTFLLGACPSLKKLPRGLMNEKRTLTECQIHGGREWCRGLMWQDDGFKSFIESTLTPYSTFLHQ